MFAIFFNLTMLWGYLFSFYETCQSNSWMIADEKVSIHNTPLLYLHIKLICTKKVRLLYSKQLDIGSTDYRLGQGLYLEGKKISVVFQWQ
uniref:Secreted protein n=2 Tax=Setaria TaxID=4554 RepID=K3XUF8_SETIT